MTLGTCKLLRDALAVWCEDCGAEISGFPIVNPWWGLNKTKAMHERGTGHKCYYLGVVDRTTQDPASTPGRS